MWHGWQRYTVGKRGVLLCKLDLKSWLAYRDWQTGMRMRGAFPQCSRVSLMAQKGQSRQLDLLHPCILQLKVYLHVWKLYQCQASHAAFSRAGLRRCIGHPGMTGLMPLEPEAAWMMAMLDHQ